MKKIETSYRLSSDKNKALDQVFTPMEKDIFMQEIAKLAKKSKHNKKLDKIIK